MKFVNHLLLAVVLMGASAVHAATIDRMTTQPIGGYTQNYAPGNTIIVLGRADTYYLNDGTSWQGGAGSHPITQATLVSVETVGNTIRYILAPPTDGILFKNTDFNSGNHSAQGVLEAVDPLVIEAEIGSNIAVMEGYARIVSNEMTSYGEPRFNFYSASVGSVVPFKATYTVIGQTWDGDIFNRAFTYTLSGYVAFADVTPPFANAGPDQVVFDSVSLDGSQSGDADGDITAYHWELRHRENGYTITAEGSTPMISDLDAGFYDVTLTVTDMDGLTAIDTMVLGAAGRCQSTNSCPGDLNGDGQVDYSDFVILRDNWGRTCP